VPMSLRDAARLTFDCVATEPMSCAKHTFSKRHQLDLPSVS